MESLKDLLNQKSNLIYKKKQAVENAKKQIEKIWSDINEEFDPKIDVIEKMIIRERSKGASKRIKSMKIKM